MNLFLDCATKDKKFLILDTTRKTMDSNIVKDNEE